MGFNQTHVSSAGGDAGGVSHSHSPRFSGPMTRRAQSFKRNPNNHHEIDFHQLNTPTSDLANSTHGFDSLLEKKQTHLLNRFKRPFFGFREWLFLLFCGFCLFLGVFEVFSSGWFGVAIERVRFNQDIMRSYVDNQNALAQSSHDYERREDSVKVETGDVEQTLMMVASNVVINQNIFTDASGPNQTARISHDALLAPKVIRNWMLRQMGTFS